MCVKGGYHLNVNEDERVTEPAAVSRSEITLISKGYRVEMLHGHRLEPHASLSKPSAVTVT